MTTADYEYQQLMDMQWKRYCHSVDYVDHVHGMVRCGDGIHRSIDDAIAMSTFMDELSDDLSDDDWTWCGGGGGWMWCHDEHTRVRHRHRRVGRRRKWWHTNKLALKSPYGD